jgi:SNF2 family DNA or RNA helicase
VTMITRDRANICVPFRPDLATLIPHARVLDHAGQKLLVMPNGHVEAKLARNLGVPVPSPILTRYDWCGQTPWEIQRITAALLVESPRAYVLNTMGTGKTRSALYAADYLIKQGRAKRVLVSAPLSTLTPVWEAEIFGNLAHLRVSVVYGPRAKRLAALKRDADVYIINHHGVAMLSRELAAKQFNVFIIDEMAVLRNKSTDLWKAHSTVVESIKGWAWGMTGSPTPMAPTDAWAQVRMITPARTTRTMSQFQDLTMRKVSQFKWIAREDANEIVHQQMQPSVRFTRDDVMELPETSFVNREVQLDPEAAKAYQMLFAKMAMLTNNGESITAQNEGILQSKLLQVASGFIYTDMKGGEKKVYQLPSTQRLAALDEVIAETDRKVIIFVPFVHALEGVTAHLRKKGHDVALIHGGISRGKRDLIFRGFQHGTSPRLLVAHPACMAHGLTLTAANTIVWYSPTQSLETYEQANARITRPGQTSKTLICHLFGTAVERATYARLRARGRMQGLLLAMFKQQELDF